MSIDSNWYLQISLPGSSTVSDSQRVTETNPLNLQYVSDTYEYTNVSATTDIYVPMNGYSTATIAYNKSWGTDTLTLKVYAIVQDDGTAYASVNYFNVEMWAGCKISLWNIKWDNWIIKK